jgi:hypothetical protein
MPICEAQSAVVSIRHGLDVLAAIGSGGLPGARPGYSFGN